MALVKDLIQGQSFLLTLETHRDNVQSALKKFALHEISSAPVFDGTKFIGFIDLLDIMTFLLAVLAKPSGGGDPSVLKQRDPLEYANEVSSFQPVIGDAPQVDEKQLSLQQLNDLVDLSRRNPFIATLPEQPVFEVLVALAKGLHRVAVCNSHDEIVNIVTQSTVIRWLNEDPARRIGAVGDKTLEELGFAFNEVPTVSWDSKMITALQKTHLGRDTGIAVVNDKEVLVGNVSASDLKLLIRPNSGLSFDSLFEPISTVLPRINKLNGRESESFVASCTPATKLSEVVKKLAELHIHRLFVVDKEGRPVGSISISQVCEILILHNHDALNALNRL